MSGRGMRRAPALAVGVVLAALCCPLAARAARPQVGTWRGETAGMEISFSVYADTHGRRYVGMIGLICPDGGGHTDWPMNFADGRRQDAYAYPLDSRGRLRDLYDPRARRWSRPPFRGSFSGRRARLSEETPGALCVAGGSPAIDARPTPTLGIGDGIWTAQGLDGRSNAAFEVQGDGAFLDGLNSTLYSASRPPSLFYPQPCSSPELGGPSVIEPDGTADTDRWSRHAPDDTRLSGRFASSDTAELSGELRWADRGFCENATIPLIARRVQVANEDVIAVDTGQRLAGGSLGIGGALGGSGDLSCKPYEIIGVRGSGEHYTAPLEMAATVGGTARYAVDALGRGRVRTTSLRYPGAPVTALVTTPNGEGFFLSIAAGETALARRLQTIARNCHRTRIAVIGYSQGAAVTSAALREVDERTRASVRAVVLYADPYSVGASPYAVTLAPPQAPDATLQRIGRGALGGVPMPLPRRVRDICFVGDLVCDQTANLPSQFAQALVAPIHSSYKTCCTGTSLLRLNGRWIARRLK